MDTFFCFLTIAGSFYNAPKKDFIEIIAEKTNVNKKDAEAVFDAVFAEIKNELVAGEKVAINGFGTFEVRERAARQGINPLTKEKIEIAACKAPAFKALFYDLCKHGKWHKIQNGNRAGKSQGGLLPIIAY